VVQPEDVVAYHECLLHHGGGGRNLAPHLLALLQEGPGGSGIGAAGDSLWFQETSSEEIHMSKL
jgi:hypothetical protein